MATIDKLTLDISVNGTANLNQADASFKNLEKSAKSAADSLKSFNTRTLTANIQDIAVQAEMGVSWLRILGQQGSEVLAAFGPQGAAAGAALAVGIALAKPVLESLGYDLRSTKERLDDLTKSTNAYLEAQKLNQTSSAGLKDQYGALSDEAKKFYEINQELSKAKSLVELRQSIKGVQEDFKDATVSAKDLGAFRFIPGMDLVAGGVEAFGALSRNSMGLTAEQAKKVGEMMKNIDANKPEQTAKTLNDILTYLKEIGADDKVIKHFTNTIEPIIKINKALLEQSANIRAVADSASQMQTAITNSQIDFLPKIGDAKRRFDQITAARLEGEQKVAEYRLQMEEKKKQGGISPDILAAEAAATENKIRQETAERVKDISNAQREAYKSALLSNDAKARQLDLESGIVKLQDQGRYTLSYEVQYQQDIAKNAKDYQDALAQINENLRKNVITESGATKLRQSALEIQNKANAIADQNRQKRINDAKDAQTAVLFEMSGKERSIAFDKEMLDLRDKMRYGYASDIEFADKTAKLKFDQAEYEKKINEEVRLGKITQADASERIAKQNELLQAQLGLEERRNQLAQSYRTFSAGWNKAIAEYVNNARDGSAQAAALFQTISSSLEDNLAKSLTRGRLLWKEFLLDLVNQLIKSNISSLFANLLGGGGQSMTKGASTIGNVLGNLLGFADGGTIPTNGPVIVGERGPEIITGAANRTVIPNNQAFGGSNVTYNINAVDAMSFKSMIAADPSFLYAVTEQGRRRLPGGM